MLQERKSGPSTSMPTSGFRQHATRVVPLDRRTRSQSFVNSARPRTCTGLQPRRSRRRRTDPRAVDELAIRKLLSDFVEAYNSMDVRRVRRFKPSFTDFPRDLSSTQLTLSNILIGPIVDRQTATVTLTAQYRNTFRRGAVPGASTPAAVNFTWRVQRKGDTWILLE